jgi:hypothetical protein
MAWVVLRKSNRYRASKSELEDRMSARLAPLEPPFAEPVAGALRRLMGGHDREPLALFRTLAHHDALLDRFRQVGSSLLSFGRLDAADRETVIHRTTARCGAAYEWGVHAALFAPAVGRDAAWLAATWSGAADDPAFGPGDELVELVCLAGFYHLVSFACGAFAVEGEPWAIPAPA